MKLMLFINIKDTYVFNFQMLTINIKLINWWRFVDEFLDSENCINQLRHTHQEEMGGRWENMPSRDTIK